MAECSFTGERIDTDANDAAIMRALENTGIPFRRAAFDRWVIMPRSNFKAWTLEQEKALTDAIEGMPFGLILRNGLELTAGKARITRNALRADRTVCYFLPGKAFRIYSASV